MKSLRWGVILGALCALLVLPSISQAQIGLGTARLVSVTPVDGGCIAGPTGPFVEAWDVEPGYIYTLTITNVTECANGGTDATLNVRVNGATGNTNIVADYVSPGVYQFNFTLPEDARCTYPVLYCTDPDNPGVGLFVVRHDGATFQSHLRASTWSEGCTDPMEIIGPECGGLPTEESSWGAVKSLYR